MLKPIQSRFYSPAPARRALALFAAALPGLALHAAAPDSTGIEFFERRIRPLLVENCYECHSHGKEIKGGLTLDSMQGARAGGESGPAVVPGKPAESLLLRAVRYQDEHLRMPPKKEKRLSADQVADLEKWISMGAPDSRTGRGAKLSPMEEIRLDGRTHWAFRPLTKPAPPKPTTRARATTEIDAFILRKLEALQMTLSPEADKRTLIRRAHYDLTGLPPSMEEVDAFVADESADAFSKLVDRLLDSPRYGERWGRHWLDVARFADTKGYLPGGVERRYPYSWTYRDYVIRAFNEDLPFDRFILEQLAADRLELGEDKRPLAALGFLTLGRRFLNNRNDIIDDRIDVVMRGFMGLTAGCARCHDHKHNPVTMADYYSLYGVFNSSLEPGELPLLGIEPDPKDNAEWKVERAKREKERDDFRAQKIAEALAKTRSRCGDYMLGVHDVGGWKDRRAQMKEIQKRKLHASAVIRWKNLLDAVAKTPHPVFRHWTELAKLPTEGFENKAKEVLDRLANEASAEPDKVNGAVMRAFKNHPPKSLKDAAQVYTDLFNGADKKWQEAKKSAKEGRPNALADAEWEPLRQVLYSEAGPPNIPAQFHNQLISGAQPRLRALQAKVDKLDATHPGAPPRAMAMVDRPKPIEPYIFIRGSAGNRGKSVPRQFPEYFAGEGAGPFSKGSGRLELAQGIASPENPLTARVIVNRVWKQHFGQGLVTTPSDFGLTADPPSHPELLDYLASWFIENGWSFKKLHRLILNSAVWRQGSVATAESVGRFAERDPDNRLLWRMNRRRLDLEGMRDSLLKASGSLDMKMGGISVNLDDHPYSNRRTVYGLIERQNLASMFRTFDFANPDASSSGRFSTTVPQQALYLMNSPFAIEQARKLAWRPEFSRLNSQVLRIQQLYEFTLQRRPSVDEAKAAATFLKSRETDDADRPNRWRRGYGRFDEASNRVAAFVQLPHYTGSAWQGGAERPDPKLGYLFWSNRQGHTGENPDKQAVLRWVATRECIVSIVGKLRHPSDQGDGVRGRIVTGSGGKLGEWTVKDGESVTNLKSIPIKRGETIDFVVDCVGNTGWDTFEWTPRIRLDGGEREWSAAKDFPLSDPRKDPLDAWERLAQALLLSNEFMFVD